MHIKPKNKMYFLNKFLIHSSKPYIIKYVNYKLPPPPPKFHSLAFTANPVLTSW